MLSFVCLSGVFVVIFIRVSTHHHYWTYILYVFFCCNSNANRHETYTWHYHHHHSVDIPEWMNMPQLYRFVISVHIHTICIVSVSILFMWLSFCKWLRLLDAATCGRLIEWCCGAMEQSVNSSNSKRRKINNNNNITYRTTEENKKIKYTDEENLTHLIWYQMMLKCYLYVMVFATMAMAIPIT